MSFLDELLGFDPSQYVTDNFFSGVNTTADAASGGALDSLGNVLTSGAQGLGDTSSWWDTILNKVTTPNALSTASGLSSVLTNYLGGSAAQSASKKALSGLQAAYDRAANSSDTQFQTALALGKPYRELGTALMPTYTQFAAGASPGRQTLGDMESGALYDWQLKQSQNQIDKAMAARGRWDSGTAVKALSDSTNQLSAQEAENKWGRALTLENMDYGRLNDAENLGGGFASQGAGLAVNTGNTLANVYSNLGTTGAAATNNVGATTKSMYSGINSGVQSGLTSAFNNSLATRLGGY